MVSGADPGVPPQPARSAGAGLFDGLSPAAAQRLTELLRPSEVVRGCTLFREGDPGGDLFLVRSGKVGVSRTGPDGREHLLAVNGPGDVFGELAVFDPGPRTTTATALTDARLDRLDDEDFQSWLTAHPHASGPLLRDLARRLRRTDEALHDLVFTDVAGRVAKALLALSERFGTACSEGVRVDHDLTQDELAQLVGAKRETVNKSLADFAARGWVAVTPRTVVILDVPRLTRRAR